MVSVDQEPVIRASNLKQFWVDTKQLQ